MIYKKEDHADFSNQPLTREGRCPWIKEDRMGKEQGLDVRERNPSKKCLASEVQAKHCRLPPDLGKGPFALYRSLGYKCQAASKFPGPRWRSL